jgi:hypothetical protein
LRISGATVWIGGKIMHRSHSSAPLFLLGALLAYPLCARAADALVFEGEEGPGRGKHIVLLSGDEEYRSEELMPMLGKILTERHGFKCTVLFSINPTNGTVDPVVLNNIPGIDALDSADLCLMKLRFRELPDEQMSHFDKYLNAGKPIVALRTSTHAFSYEKNKKSPYARYDWRSTEWPGGFGQQVLGETWISHHGDHGTQSTRGVINEAHKNHPILRGVSDIWGPTDVYGVVHLPSDAKVLVWGQVLSGMKPDDPPVEGAKNSPLMPLAWLREYESPSGKVSKIFTTTMGASVDFQSEGLRRLVVNACYWATGLEEKIPPRSDVKYVGEYKPTWFGFGKYKSGLKPSDFK